jgi:hypothetical protein
VTQQFVLSVGNTLPPGALATDEAIRQAEQLFGPNVTPAGTQLVQDEIDAWTARQADPAAYITALYEEYLGRTPDPGGLQNYLDYYQRTGSFDAVRSSISSSPEARAHGAPNTGWDPTGIAGIGKAQLGNMSQGDWMALLSTAEQWAGTVGWKYFPSAQMLNGLYHSGIYLDQQAAARWLSENALPPEVRKQMPWAASGLSAQAYHQRIQGYVDSLETYTGSRDPINDDLLHQAATEGWSAQRVVDHFLNDQSFQSRFGWTKYGMTYAGFQQMKQQGSVRQHIQSRYGASALNSDSAFLSDLANPLTQVSAQGGRQQADQSYAARLASGSEVR